MVPDLYRLAILMVDRILQWHAWIYIYRSQGIAQKYSNTWLGYETFTVHIFETELGAR